LWHACENVSWCSQRNLQHVAGCQQCRCFLMRCSVSWKDEQEQSALCFKHHQLAPERGAHFVFTNSVLIHLIQSSAETFKLIVSTDNGTTCSCPHSHVICLGAANLIDNEADLFVTLPTEQNQSDQLVKVHATEGINKLCRV